MHPFIYHTCPYSQNIRFYFLSDQLLCLLVLTSSPVLPFPTTLGVPFVHSVKQHYAFQRQGTATSAQPPHITSPYCLLSEQPCQGITCASLVMSQLEVHGRSSPETGRTSQVCDQQSSSMAHGSTRQAEVRQAPQLLCNPGKQPIQLLGLRLGFLNGLAFKKIKYFHTL